MEVSWLSGPIKAQAFGGILGVGFGVFGFKGQGRFRV